jgi:hypothetical protein
MSSSHTDTTMKNDAKSANSSTRKRYLPSGYSLSDTDVICGRGTTCFNHSGNERFRRVIESQLHRYLNTLSKLDKTMLIYEIVTYIRVSGNFVKLDKSNGRYYEVGDYHAVSKAICSSPMRCISYFRHIDSFKFVSYLTERENFARIS